MKKYISIGMFVLIALIAFNGCSNKPKYVELTKETFQTLDVSKVMSVTVVSTETKKNPEEWAHKKYTHVFSNLSLVDIKAIHQHISKADEFNSSLPFTDRRILFETKGVIYYTGIYWDNKQVYGDWWVSSDLRKLFLDLGVTPPNGEKNPPKSVMPTIWPVDSNML